jgi:SAM-dependent methyltransferase
VAALCGLVHFRKSIRYLNDDPVAIAAVLDPMKQKHLCAVCGASALKSVDGYVELPRVTSDCRPRPAGGCLTVCQECGAIQKMPTAEWVLETKDIYAKYDLWPLSAGREQPIFLGNGSVRPRSSLLVDFVRQEAALPLKGRFLDIGCGTGAAITSFATEYPAWRLNGADLSERALPYLEKIPGFDRLFTGEISAIEGKFELVCMIHSLEHFPDPHRGLVQARDRLTPGGVLFVEVPNVATNPFDLLIADHLLHFTPSHLRRLARRAGLGVSTVRDDVLPKEITMLATRTSDRASAEPELAARHWFDCSTASVRWLSTVLSEAQKHASEAKRAGRPFGIFGTSISGMWLYGALGGLVDFFVDEDSGRQGQNWEGLPVLRPDEVRVGACVYIPLIPEVAARLAGRLGGGSVSYIETPPFDVIPGSPKIK